MGVKRESEGWELALVAQGPSVGGSRRPWTSGCAGSRLSLSNRHNQPQVPQMDVASTAAAAAAARAGVPPRVLELLVRDICTWIPSRRRGRNFRSPAAVQFRF